MLQHTIHLWVSTCVCVREYLCEGPPVHVGAANVYVFLVHNPELGVKDAWGELSHVNSSDISSWKKHTHSYCQKTNYELESKLNPVLCASQNKETDNSDELTETQQTRMSCYTTQTCDRRNRTNRPDWI